MYEKYKLFCLALGESLNDIIKEAIDKKQNESDKNEFNSGYLCGFHRIVTLMQQQAEIFEIPFEEIGIDLNETDLIL
jgi:hypothetical protein